ncbi:MAG: Spy/CpxP family protein refolding chaperone [Methylophilaceae bacterium]
MNNLLKTKSTFSLKHALVAAFLAISVPAASMAYAKHGDDKGYGHHKGCERGEMMGHGMHKGIPPYLHGLDLTSAQKDQLFNLNYAQIPVMRDHHKQEQQLHEDLRTLSQTDKFDDVKAQQLADKAAQLEKEKVLAMARNNAKIFALLTPEQRKKAREFKMEKHGLGYGEHRHERRDDDSNH